MTLIRKPKRSAQDWLWLAPYFAISLFAVAMLALTAVLQWRELETARSALEGDMHWAERTIEAHLLGHHEMLAQLETGILTPGSDPATFKARAIQYLQDNPDLLSILWVNAKGAIRWRGPEHGANRQSGDSLPLPQRQILQDVLEKGRQTYSPVYQTQLGRHSIDLALPLRQGDKPVGALIAVHSLENLLSTTLPTWFMAKYRLALLDENGRELFSNTNLSPSDRSVTGTIHFTLFEKRLAIHFTAYRNTSSWNRYLPAATIVLLTLLVAASLLLLRRNAQKRAVSEEKLHDAYVFRQAMSQSLLTAIRAVDMQGRITYVNAAFCRLVGWSAEELIGLQAPYPYWPPEEQERFFQHYERTLSGEAQLGRSEMRIMHRNGERIDVSVYVSPLIDDTGRQLGWMVAMNDITESKRVLIELEQAQERFVTVVNSLDSALHVFDIVSGEILFANRTFLNLFGDDAIGRISQVVTCELPVPVNQNLPSRLLTPADLPREIFSGEIQHLSNHRWYYIHDRAIRWVDGRTVRVRIASDITERKNIDELNRQQQKRVEETSRLITMGEMASSLAHELNQPLAAIANYCAGSIKRLQSGSFRNEDLLLAMQRAASQAQRAGTIIQRMRDMVRKNDPHLAAVALAEIIEETRALADIEAQRYGAEISVTLPENLPLVIVDRIMIEQVLLNLAKNGMEAMQGAGTAERRLEITAALYGERMMEVSVSDRGPGLTEKDMEKVFAPFYTTKAEGLGIGLSICRSMIEFHQGRLWAEARPEGGTVFKFTVPREI